MKQYFIIITLISSQLSMTQERFDNLLGKHIKEVELKSEYRKYSDNDMCSYFFETPVRYFNNTIQTAYMELDNREKIKAIDLKLGTLIDKSFYDNFVSIYGTPDKIIVSDVIVSESEKKTQNKTLKKTEHKARQGTFEEKPTFIIWEKEDFQLRILMKYPQEISEITFTKRVL